MRDLAAGKKGDAEVFVEGSKGKCGFRIKGKQQERTEQMAALERCCSDGIDLKAAPPKTSGGEHQASEVLRTTVRTTGNDCSQSGAGAVTRREKKRERSGE